MVNMLMEKPYEKAFLGYNKEKNIYEWFIKASDCPPWPGYAFGSRPCGPREIKSSPNNLWNLNKEDPTHAKPKYWESIGWVFFNESEEKENEVTQTVEELQNKLIDYCALKSSRIKHLKKLTQAGALDPYVSYPVAARIIRDYLNTDNNVCPDGAQRALEALGLVEKKWVEKFLTVSEINKLNLKHVKLSENGTKLDELVCSMGLVKDVLHKGVPASMVVKVWVLE